MGRCPDCGQWDSLVETSKEPKRTAINFRSSAAPQAIDQISINPEIRICTGIGEFDRILGGGVVSGSVILIGGEPGIGKSTLVLQVLDRLAMTGITALYVTGEESIVQIKMRASRLAVSSQDLYVLAVTSLEECLEKASELKPSIVAVDSIQTMYSEEFSSAPGTVGQVREVAAKLINFSKSTNIPVFLIGHVTK